MQLSENLSVPKRTIYVSGPSFLFLQPALGKGVVGGEGGRQDRRDHEGEDVQAIQQNLPCCTLNRMPV